MVLACTSNSCEVIMAIFNLSSIFGSTRTVSRRSVHLRTMSNLVIPPQSGSDGTIDVQFKDEIAIITMKRGENRINNSFISDFSDALDLVESNKNVKALITTGSGKYYSIGLDLNWLNPTIAISKESGAVFEKTVGDLFKRLLSFPVPTIAAFNGHAYAGGAVLGILHDYKIMNRDRGWFCFNEVHIGIPFKSFAAEILKAKLGAGQTLHEAAVLGKKYTGPEALKAGIIHAAVKNSDLITEAVQLARQAIAAGQGGYHRNTLKSRKEAMYKSIIDMPDENPIIKALL